MSNHTHRTMPSAKRNAPKVSSSWGGGVWQLALIASFAVLYVLLSGPATTDSQSAFRQALVILSLLALLVAAAFQQLRRAREAEELKARR